MNNSMLQVFRNSEFGELEIVMIDGKEHFPATACAKMLGYTDPYDAIKRHTKGSVKHRVLTPGGEQERKFIPEGDLYRLIVHSKLPSAERFERWVFDEVVPTIRKQGAYAPDLSAFLEQAFSSILTRLEKLEEKGRDEIVLEDEPLRRRRPTSVISRLDVKTKKDVESMICSGQYTYMEIKEYLAELGVKTSTSSVWRYAQTMGL